MYNLIEQIPLTEIQLFEKYKRFPVDKKNVDPSVHPFVDYFDHWLQEFAVDQDDFDLTCDILLCDFCHIIIDVVKGDFLSIAEFSADPASLIIYINQLMYEPYVPSKLKVSNFSSIYKAAQFNQYKNLLIKERAVFRVDSNIIDVCSYSDFQKIPVTFQALITKLITYHDRCKVPVGASDMIFEDLLALDSLKQWQARSEYEIQRFFRVMFAIGGCSFNLDTSYLSKYEDINAYEVIMFNQLVFDSQPDCFKISNQQLFLELGVLNDYIELLRVEDCIFQVKRGEGD